jgi:hypothetical protein
VRVAVVDQRLAGVAGVRGVVFSVARGDGVAGRSRVGLRVGYAAFKWAYGGDYGARLRLVALPACVLTTPSARECQTLIRR